MGKGGRDQEMRDWERERGRCSHEEETWGWGRWGRGKEVGRRYSGSGGCRLTIMGEYKRWERERLGEMREI
jgi:hypothetical protein